MSSRSWKWFCAALVACTALPALAIDVTGDLAGDVVWRPADSPVVLTGNVRVVSGASLRVEPGVTVGASGAYSLTVLGTLKTGVDASGAADPAKPVVFRGTGTKGGWRGLVLAAGSHALQNTEIAFAQTGLTVESASATLDDCVVRENSVSGVIATSTASTLVVRGTGTAFAGAKARITGNGSTSSGYGVQSAGALTLANVEISGNYVGAHSSGNAQIAGSYVHENLNYGVVFLNALAGGSQSFQRNVVWRNRAGGLHLNLTTSGITHLVDHNTFADNDQGGATNAAELQVAALSTGTLTVTNNIFTDNRGFTIGGTRTGGTVTLRANLHHGTTSGSTWWTGTGDVLGNPLLASQDGTNFRPTENSPARDASSDTPAQDLGALPFAGDPTVPLLGILRSNRTVRKADGNVALAGDLVVAPGVTLTLEPGARLVTASGDLMGAGSNRNSTELVVQGRLIANGTVADRIVIGPASPTTSFVWDGLRFEGASGTSQVAHVEISNGATCVAVKTTGLVLRNLRLHDCSANGLNVSQGASATLTGDAGTRGGLYDLASRVWATGAYAILAEGELTVSNTDIGPASSGGIHFSGKATITNNRVHDTRTDYAIRANVIAAGSTISRNVVYANAYGVGLQTSSSAGTLSFDHNTIDGNGAYGVYLTHSSGSAATYVFRGNIVTSNGSYGIYKSGSASGPSLLNNLVRGHTYANHTGLSAGTGSLSSDPLFNAPATRDYRLQPTSPARGADGLTPAGDLGALPFFEIPVGTITVSPANPSGIPALGVQAFSAIGYEASTTVPIAGLQFAWSVANGGGAIDAATGVFTAGCTTGTFANTIRASAGDASGTTGVTVVGGAATTVSVKPPIANVGLSSKVTYTAEQRDGCGNVTTEAITWGQPPAGVGVMSPTTGEFTSGTRAGTFENVIVATSRSGASGRATVVIAPGPLATILVDPQGASVPAGQAGRFLAKGSDSFQNSVPVTPAWSLAATCASTLPGSAIDAASGLFTAGTTAGTCSQGVVATEGSVSGRSSITVTTGALASMTLAASATSVPTNGSVRFTATGRDANGALLAVNPSWSVSSGGGAIDQNGTYTAGCTAGPHTITATQSGITATTTVTVTAGAVATMSLSPVTASIAIKATQAFTVTNAKDACGNTVTVTPSWTVVAGGGSIDASGRFTAGTTLGTFTNTVRALAGAALAQATVTVTPGPLAGITIAPAQQQLPIQGSVRFTATGRDAGGNAVDVTPTWSVTGGGTIDASGNLTAGLVAGTWNVRATAGSIVGSAPFTVVAGPLASIVVTPSGASVQAGGPLQLAAAGRDAGGNAVTAPITWSVVAGGGTISTSGLFTAGNTAGTYANTIRAASGGVSATVGVIVTPGPASSLTIAPASTTLAVLATQAFTATGRDSFGNTFSVSPTWSVVNGGGTIGSSSGIFTAGRTPGTFANTVRAALGTVAATASVVVQAGALARIEVSPDPIEADPGETVQLTARGFDAVGNAVAITPTWIVEAGGGTISQAGLFTAGTSAGFYEQTVVAAQGTVRLAVDVEVVPGPAVRIAISPATATLQVFQRFPFDVVGFDRHDNERPVAVTWASTAGGSIASDGTFTAGGTVGRFTNAITATSGQMSASASVVVTPGPVTYLTISPPSATLAIGATQRFTVTGTDVAGNAAVFTPVWSTLEGGAIDASGLFTAGTSAGIWSAAVVVEAGDAIASATVSVLPDPASAIVIQPDSTELRARASTPFNAFVTDRFGNEVAGAVTWSVATAAAGSITSAGLFTAGRVAGSYPRAVVARSGTLGANADVVVTPGVLAEVVVTPAHATVRSAEKTRFTAEGRDVDGNKITLQPVWSVSANVGSISGGGELTAGDTPGRYDNAIRAGIGDVTGFGSVTITPAEVRRIDITPANPIVAMGGRTTFRANAYGVRNQLVQGATVAWSVVAGGGTISDAGVFVAGTGEGTFERTVQAAIGDVKATTNVVIPSDFDQDGLGDAWEVAAGLDPTDARDAAYDKDGDHLSNRDEFAAQTGAADADSDDDGVHDGSEPRWNEDTDEDGTINALDEDSDGDGVLDGTEMALTGVGPDTDLEAKHFVEDADPSTSTDPANGDTDGDTLSDGFEDRDHDGRLGAGETDPNVAEPECASSDDCAEGKFCSKGRCLPPLKCVPECGAGFECSLDGECSPEEPEEERRSRGCGCGAGDAGAAALLVVGALARRRRAYR